MDILIWKHSYKNIFNELFRFHLLSADASTLYYWYFNFLIFCFNIKGVIGKERVFFKGDAWVLGSARWLVGITHWRSNLHCCLFPINSMFSRRRRKIDLGKNLPVRGHSGAHICLLDIWAKACMKCRR